MSIPLDMDPGHRDPQSPLFNGCHHCGTYGKSSPCRECEREQERKEARAKHYEQEYREYKQTQEMLKAFEENEQPPTPPSGDEGLPREVRIEMEHRAESAYRSLRDDE